MKRVMCLWFPNWPIQRRLAADPSGRHPATILHGLARGKTRVIACCRNARQRGVTPGMLLAEAQSLWPSAAASVRFEEHDPLADRHALRELALWCHQFSPTVAVDDAETPDCLLLDATGLVVEENREQRTEDRGQKSNRLSSLSSVFCPLSSSTTEKQFADEAIAALERRGYWGVAAIADTIGTAWAVAHHGAIKRRLVLVPPRGQKDALRSLPVEALRLPVEAVQTLHDLNVFRIDELFVLPRTELPSRFGVELLRCIDRALGRTPEMLTPVPPAEPLEASWDFEPGIADGRILVTVIEQLLERLLSRPGSHALRGSPFIGVQRLLCSLKLADRERLYLPIELLRPSGSQRDVMELVKLKVERLRITTEVVAVTVRVERVAPLEFQQAEIFGGNDWGGRNEVIGLLERLSSRLGEKAVLRPRLEPDAQPEYACAYDPLAARRWATFGAERDGCAKPHAAVRPIVLKKRPIPIAAGSLLPGEPIFDCIVERCWGPERIETGWWRGDDVRRDYYIVETDTGERFWVFRNLLNESWYLHGIFA